MNSITSLRQEIDQLHEELRALLLRRRDLTMEIWKLKQEQGLPFFSADREEQILETFVKANPQSTAAPDPDLEKLLRGVMTAILREYEGYLSAKYPKKP